MAYAAVTDMVARFGAQELIRLTTPDGEPLTSINQASVTRALGDASAIIDTFLRKRYLVPVTEVLPELNRAACFLARYDLAFGEQTEPTEQMRLARKEVMDWLASIRDGTIVLDGAIPSGDESYASMSDRGFTTFADDGDPTGTNVNSPPAPAPSGFVATTDQSFYGPG
jgi:phage gp36-like protein